jgi:phosphohistidine phosphatase
MKLIIARHGEAEASSKSGYDKDRSLTEKGKKDIEKMAIFLKTSSINVAHIYHSDYLRTTQTAEIYASHLGSQIEIIPSNELTPEGNCMDILPQLKKFNNSEGILLVSHNPGVSYFAAKLIFGEGLSQSFPFLPGTTMALNIPREKFINGQIIWMLSPNDIN